MFDVRKLRMLAELDRLGTVAAVAVELNLTAPGISMQIAGLEREVGVALTEKRGRRLSLTPAGSLLAAHGREIMDRLSLAQHELDGIRDGGAGRYRLAAFPSAARTFVVDVLSRLRREESALELSLTTPEPERGLDQLIAGDTDMSLIHAYSNVPRDLPDGILCDDLVVEPIWLAMRCDHRHVGEVVDLVHLADEQWITPVRSTTCAEMTYRACGLAGFHPSVAAETMDFGVQLELVRAGVGVALVPELTVATLPREVVLVRPSFPLQRHIFAARRSTMEADNALNLLVDLMREAAVRRAAIGG